MSKGEKISSVLEPENSDSGKHGGRRNNNRGRNNDVPFPVVGVDVSQRDGASTPTVEVENGTLKYLKSVNENMRRQGEAEALEKLKSRLRTVFPDNLEKIVRRGGTGTRKPLSQEEVIEHFLKTHSGLEKFALQSRWDRVLGSVKRYFQSGDFTNGLLGIRDEGARKRKTDQVLAFIGMKGVDEWEKEGNPGSVVQNQSDLPLVDSPEGNVSSQEDVSDVAQDADQTGDQKLVQMEQRAPNEDGVVDGVGLVEEPKPEIVFDEDESNSVVAPDQVGAVVEGSKPKIVFDKDASHGEVVNDQDGDFEYQASLGDVPDMKMDLQGGSKKEEFREKDIEQGGLGSAEYKEAIDDMAEEKLGKKPLEQGVPNEDGVVEGVGLAEEPKPEIVFDDELPLSKLSLEKDGVEKSGSKNRALEELYRQEEVLRRECNEKGERYARVCGRNDSLRHKIFSKLPFLRKTIEMQDEQKIAEMKVDYERSLSELRQVRVEIAKQEAEANGESESEVRKAMANELLFLDKGEAIRIAGLWSEEKRTDRRKSKALRVAEDLTKWYRSLPTSTKIGVGLALFGASLLTGKSVPLFILAIAPRLGGAASLTESLGEIFGNRAFEQEIERMGREKEIDANQEWSENDLKAFLRNETAVTRKFDDYRKRISKQSKYLAGGGLALFLGGTAVSAAGLLQAMEQVSDGGGAMDAIRSATTQTHNITIPAQPVVGAISPLDASSEGASGMLSDSALQGSHATEIANKIAETIEGSHPAVRELVVGAKSSLEGIMNVSGFSDGDSHLAYLHFLEEMKTQGEDTAALDKLLQHGVRAGDTISVEMVDGKPRIVGIERAGVWKHFLQSFTEGNAQSPTSSNVSELSNSNSTLGAMPNDILNEKLPASAGNLIQEARDMQNHLPQWAPQTPIEQSTEPSSTVPVSAVSAEEMSTAKTIGKVSASIVAGSAGLAGAGVVNRRLQKRKHEKKSNLKQESLDTENDLFFRKIFSIQNLHGRARESFKNIRDYFVSSPTDDLFRRTLVRKELCQILLDESENRLSDDFLREPFWTVMGSNKQEFLVLQALFEKTGEKFPWDIQYRSADDVLNLFAERFVTGKLPREFSGK